VNARIDQLLDEALSLEVEERSALALALLESLDGEDQATFGRAWADEIERRREALRQGRAQAVPWSEARARLSAL
jgi:putative addiction module component (TIGR02574 family)